MTDHPYTQPTDAEALEAWLLEAIEDRGEVDREDHGTPRPDAWRYRDTGLLTQDNGILLRLDNGAEFQITIVRSRQARAS